MVAAHQGLEGNIARLPRNATPQPRCQMPILRERIEAPLRTIIWESSCSRISIRPGLRRPPRKESPTSRWDFPPGIGTARRIEQQQRVEAARQEREGAHERNRSAGTKPSRELAADAGVYEEPAYGVARVSAADGKLSIQMRQCPSGRAG